LPAFQYLGGGQGRALLESALAEPQQTFDRRFLYRTIFDKAAALFRSIVKNHPLVDGNKRLALTTVAVFLTLNGYLFYVPLYEAVEFTLRVAASEPDMPWKEISRWLRRYSISVRQFLAMDEAEQVRLLSIVEAATGHKGRYIKMIREIVYALEGT